MKKVRIFHGHLEYIMAIWYILWPFSTLVPVWYSSPVLVYCVKNNLATLPQTFRMPNFRLYYSDFNCEAIRIPSGGKPKNVEEIPKCWL
jgi:hypothetical protein